MKKTYTIEIEYIGEENEPEPELKDVIRPFLEGEDNRGCTFQSISLTKSKK